jgi:type I restriction enzyme M protein
MLDTDTKRRIDTARDILVGKVPDPKSQVEQITIALIYKFMDDMDAEAEELGGNRKFFAGEFARYGWAKLMRSGLGGHETLNLYAEAITKMPENPGIPPLFRGIFKNAFLPYRDPETLKMFLKVIDEFSYDHSERLGDAFEYLLSVLGSQGDAGQFRTPRHIIDFIVEVVDPKKTDVVLDPACGTAGFLISSYKHILKANTDTDGHSTLTPDERGRLAANFKGYDISPDMVRLSLVNMYLHGFTDPHIAEYDTLTSQEKWNEYADVILANPPFMSPKGGIKPHNRFSVQSKRSEVLFVDYMAEHLTPNGRAGIIVPEGIIFQSQNAYTQLRKMLVEDYLVAVVSLPAGVFNPYSGVKTSILILDKALAKQTDRIGFFKIENDGFGLGAQRRPIDKDDLPQARAEIAEYLRRLRARESVEDFEPTLGLIVPKEKIAANGDYNLSGERYRVATITGSSFPYVVLSDLCEVVRGMSYTTEQLVENGTGTALYNLKSIKRKDQREADDFKYVAGEVQARHRVQSGDVLIALTDLTPTSELIGAPKFLRNPPDAAFSADLGKLRFKSEMIVPQFLFEVLKTARYREYIVTCSHGTNVKHLQVDGFLAFEIPLPPLEVQKEIVAEIEGYQKVIDGARAVLDNYRPHIPIHPDWPVVELGEQLVSVFSGVTPKGGKEIYVGEGVLFIRSQNVLVGSCDFSDAVYITPEIHKAMERSRVQKGDVFLNITGASIGRSAVMPLDCEANVNQHVAVLRTNGALDHVFLSTFLNSDTGQSQIYAMQAGASREALNYAQIRQLRVPLPPLETQRAIVAEIEAEQTLVNANRELIERMEKKIQATLARVWGEDKTVEEEA